MSKDYFPIPDTSGMEPLTLEQYNALDGHPVIVEKNTMKKWWEIAHSLSGDTCGYGRYWWAYAYPAHIDREAWTAEWMRGEYPSGTHYLYCRNCGEKSGKRSMFCPNCGRAMTPEAWAMLEKRLRG